MIGWQSCWWRGQYCWWNILIVFCVFYGDIGNELLCVAIGRRLDSTGNVGLWIWIIPLCVIVLKEVFGWVRWSDDGTNLSADADAGGGWGRHCVWMRITKKWRDTKLDKYWTHTNKGISLLIFVGIPARNATKLRAVFYYQWKQSRFLLPSPKRDHSLSQAIEQANTKVIYKNRKNAIDGTEVIHCLFSSLHHYSLLSPHLNVYRLSQIRGAATSRRRSQTGNDI